MRNYVACIQLSKIKKYSNSHARNEAEVNCLYYRYRNITKLLSQEEVIKVCPSKNKDNVYVY